MTSKTLRDIACGVGLAIICAVVLRLALDPNKAPADVVPENNVVASPAPAALPQATPLAKVGDPGSSVTLYRFVDKEAGIACYRQNWIRI